MENAALFFLEYLPKDFPLIQACEAEKTIARSLQEGW
ncbi:hypothetical protein DB41_BU00010 [Neochlamydia sp. TUME1]|nr:hypothetical protein DB41_BU00010 [Neochlamydia sp. TUME1]